MFVCGLYVYVKLFVQLTLLGILLECQVTCQENAKCQVKCQENTDCGIKCREIEGVWQNPDSSWKRRTILVCSLVCCIVHLATTVLPTNNADAFYL